MLHHNTASILIVDDEPILRLLYEAALTRAGHRTCSAGSMAEARAQLTRRFDVVLVDLRLPDGLGLELLHELRAARRTERCIVVTGCASVSHAVDALRAGAIDFLTKPVPPGQLRHVVASALHGPPPTRQDDRRMPAQPQSPGGTGALARLVGNSAEMRATRACIAKLARGRTTVHIHGETGTGKELAARALHDCSPRAAGPWIAVHCGAVPEALLEAEFFGVKKGAYTGATQNRQGFFQAAHGGTLFLDEIAELPLAMQSKLLRAIQERRVRPLGSTEEHPTDVRLVSATHRNLATEVAQGRFRADLYYRLSVAELHLPPLRTRRADLPILIEVLLARIAQQTPPHDWRVAPDFIDAMTAMPFPGNVRELENLLQRAVALSDDGVLRAEHIASHGGAPPTIAATPHNGPWAAPLASATPAPSFAGHAAPHGSAHTASPGLPLVLKHWQDEQERALVVRALQQARYNQSAAAALLGLNLRQLRYRIQRLRISIKTIKDVVMGQTEPTPTPARHGHSGRYQPARWVASPNCDDRPAGAQIDLIVVHSISLPPGVFDGDAVEQLFTNTLDWQAHPYFERIRGLRVSAHFFIRRNGSVVQFVNTNARAWHAGVSSYAGRQARNDDSIGIELEGLEGGCFTAAQYTELAQLCQTLRQHYPIHDIAGHEDIAPGRKQDPGAGFDWRRLALALQWPATMFPPRVRAQLP